MLTLSSVRVDPASPLDFSGSLACALFPSVDGMAHVYIRAVAPLSAFRAYAGRSALQRAAFSARAVESALAARAFAPLGRRRFVPFVSSIFVSYLDAAGGAVPSSFVSAPGGALNVEVAAGAVSVEYAFMLYVPSVSVPGVLSALGVE